MINFNGKIINNTEEGISFENRGLHYGDALFETLRISEGKILFWEDHYFRLMASMRILRMEIPMSFSMEYLEIEILKTVEALENPSNNFRAKLFINRKAGGKYTPNTNDIDYFIVCETLETPFYTLNEEPYEVALFKDYYVPSSMLSTLKTSSKVINVLGSIFAKENDYDNCLLLNEKKQVVEALNGNVFLVKGTEIITPPIEEGCLKGVLRKQIISICSQSDLFTIEEKSISPFSLQKADELFLTNVIVGIQPITNYRKKEYKSVIAGELLQKLNKIARTKK